MYQTLLMEALMDINNLITFFGWMTLINIIILFLSFIILVVMKKSILNIHAKLFNIKKEKLNEIYLKFLSNYKILIIFFNLVPYIALKLIF